MILSKQFLEEIKSSVSILDFASDLKGFSPAGTNRYKACCPFHEEKTPSFYIDVSQQFFHCFGCGAGGDVIHFVRQVQGIDFMEAVKVLAEKAGIKIEKSELLEKNEKENELLYKIFDAAAGYYRDSLAKNKNKAVHGYIGSRMISKATLNLFDFGFANGGSELYQFLKERGFRDEDIIKSGLAKEKGGSFFDFFFGRIVIPIRDHSNRVVGFGARLFKDIPNAPKYVNSQESILFKKGEILFNFSAARMFVAAKKQRLVVVEGYMDCIMATQFGYGAVVAPLGTSMTVSQVKQVMVVDKNPLICFNSDKAGLVAMVRCAKMFLPEIKPGTAPSFVILKNAKDVDELLLSVKSEDALGLFESAIANSLQLQDFLWDHISIDIESGNPNSMSILEERVTELAELVGDKIVKKSYLRFFKDKIYQLSRTNTSYTSIHRREGGRVVNKALNEHMRAVNATKNTIDTLGFYRYYAVYILIFLLIFPFCLLYVVDEGSTLVDADCDGDILKLKNMIMDGYFFEFVPEDQEDVRIAMEEISSTVSVDFSTFGNSYEAFLESRLSRDLKPEGGVLMSEETVRFSFLSNENLKRDIKKVLQDLKKINMEIPHSLAEILFIFSEIKKKILKKRLQDKIEVAQGNHASITRLVEEKSRLTDV